MENKYLNYKKSLKKVSNIKIFDEKTGKKRNLKSKEDYRVFFNSKSKINMKLKEGLPRFPDKYYEKNENINFNWFDWLSLEKNNHYHFKGKFKKHTVDTKIKIETIKTKNNVSLNLEKFFADLKIHLFKKYEINTRREWIEFYKLCDKESHAGSILSLQNFFKKNDKLNLIKFSWQEITGAKIEKIDLDEDINSEYTNNNNYLKFSIFRKRIRSTLKYLKKNKSIFKVKENETYVTSIKDWKKFYKKFRHVIYFHDSVLKPNEVKNISSYSYNRNLVPYYPHIFYKKEFVSYANLFEISFLHENIEIVKKYTFFKDCPELIDIFLKNENSSSLITDMNLNSSIKEIMKDKISNKKLSLIMSLISHGLNSAWKDITELTKHSSNSLKSYTWKCFDCNNEFKKSFKHMSNKSVPISLKHDVCFSPKRAKEDKYYFTQKKSPCENCFGRGMIPDEFNPYIINEKGEKEENLVKCPSCSS